MKKQFKKIVIVIAGISIIFISKKFVIDNCIVSGESMYPTLHNNDILWVEKYDNDYKRFDIVTIKTSSPFWGKTIIKRIIGLPNEKVQIINGDVYINGEKLNDVDVPVMENGGIAENELYLGEDEYFVLGDNRNNSNDSRSGTIGIIKEKDIQGKAVIRFFPINRICNLQE